MVVAKRKSAKLPPPPDGMRALTRAVHTLDGALRDALARKPNQALVDLVGQSKSLVYQLKCLRTELDGVQDQLRKNTDAVSRLLGLAPTLTTVGAPQEAITDAEVDRRIREGLKSLATRGAFAPEEHGS
jgi:hypothetical protein